MGSRNSASYMEKLKRKRSEARIQRNAEKELERELSGIKTVDEMREYAYEKYGIWIVNADDVDIEVLRDVVRAKAEFDEVFPGLVQSVNITANNWGMDFESDTFAAQQYNTIHINDPLKGEYGTAVANVSGHVAGGVKGVFVHELAHVGEYNLALREIRSEPKQHVYQSRDDEEEWANLRVYNSVVSTRIVDRAISTYRSRTGSKATVEKILGSVSDYAAGPSRSESLAELVTDYVVNGGSAHRVSAYAVDIVRELERASR